ncbi:uncharacterized protein METZ01_LOCUS119790 [marine metagenome]|jgi:hypothetical protein|uniref:Uncharacterized protein n=1 Tax=marine metagenome TaxID=408172 RepID=A0A381XQ69_9ZZZZ|tara:strand:+ start:826 stop:1374 length:549 start_codon:yes stop_codon:yes gene_type:complete
MVLENILKKYKETPQGVRSLLDLSGLILAIIIIFIIFHNIFPGENKKTEENTIAIESDEPGENYEEIISSLPSGKVNFYESKDGYQLTLAEYEAVCKNTKIVTQRAVMGAHITDIDAQKLYKDNGNNMINTSVKWDSSSNACMVEYTLEAVVGTTHTITVVGQAKGFLNTGIDTRVYFIKSY